MSSRQSPKLAYPGGRKSLLGFGAFAVAFAVFYAAVGIDVWSALDSIVVTLNGESLSMKDQLKGLAVSENAYPGSPVREVTVEGWKAAGIFLFGAHLIRSVVLPEVFDYSIAPVIDAGGPYLLLLLVPPLVLIAAGFLATRGISGPYDFRYDLGGSTARRYAWNAALPVTFGYLPMVIAGMFLFVGTFTPNLLTGIFLAGLLYPMLFGGLGGMVRYALTDDYENEQDDNAFLQRVQGSD